VMKPAETVFFGPESQGPILRPNRFSAAKDLGYQRDIWRVLRSCSQSRDVQCPLMTQMRHEAYLGTAAPDPERTFTSAKMLEGRTERYVGRT